VLPCQRTVSGHSGQAGLAVRRRAVKERDVELDVVTTRFQATTDGRVSATAPTPGRASLATAPVGHPQ